MSSSKLTISDKPHIIIRASAGSGKTYQLSTRYLDLLYRDALSQSILATTFTRKAAGEILERILRKLAEAATSASDLRTLAAALTPENHALAGKLTKLRVQEMLRTLCRSLHRASVSTIDSFFHRIASSFRYELKLPPDPRLVDGNDAMAVRLRMQAIEAMLGDEDVDLLIDLLKRLHHDQTKRSITDALDEIISALYDTYRVTQREQWHQLEAPTPLTADEVATLQSGLDDAIAAATDKRTVDALRKARQAALEGDWQQFITKGIPAVIACNPIEPTYYSKPIAPQIVAAVAPLVAHAKAVLLTYLARQTEASYDLLHRFDAHYTRLRQQQRLLLYSDLPYKLAHELPRNDAGLLTEICYRLDGSVGHLLLDEFQDTSFDQWRVLGLFAEEVTAHSDGSRTFFCVGDVKQAIYGWRGGRAELFNQIPAQLNLTSDAQVTLDVSYRSSQVVLDVVNTVFSSLPVSPAWTQGEGDRLEATRWAQDFRNHQASDRSLPGYVEFITSPPIIKKNKQDADHSADDGEGSDGDAPMPREYESFVAHRIAKLHREQPAQSIGVLVSTNKAAVPLLRQLRELGVDASAEGRSSLQGDPAVEAVLSALRLADHPGHTAATFHVLNSPLASIIDLRSMRASDAAATALTIRTQLLARGFAAVLGDWAQQLAPFCDASSARKLLQLIELADRYEIDASARLGPFIEAVEAADFEEPSTSPVRVMTIHKSKGLEFDIVVLPQLGKKMGDLSKSKGVTILRDPMTDEVQAVHRGTSKEVRALSPALEAAYQQERMRRLRDDLCTLYVAMTRAKQSLHLITQPVTTTKNGLGTRGLSDQSFASLLRHALCDEPEKENPEGEQMLFKHGEATAGAAAVAVAGAGKTSTSINSAATTAPVPAAATAAALPRSRRIVSPSSLHQQKQRNIKDILAIAPSVSQSRGTMIHHWLEQIQWLTADSALPSDDLLLKVAHHAMPVAGGREDWLKEQIAMFRATLKFPGVISALSPPVIASGETIELWRERDFAVRLHDDLLRGTFDRVVIVKRNEKPVRAQIIDFKSDIISSDKTLKDRAEHYRPQIDAYRAALMKMLSLPSKSIKATLLFLSNGQSCEV